MSRRPITIDCSCKDDTTTNPCESNMASLDNVIAFKQGLVFDLVPDFVINPSVKVPVKVPVKVSLTHSTLNLHNAYITFIWRFT